MDKFKGLTSRLTQKRAKTQPHTQRQSQTVSPNEQRTGLENLQEYMDTVPPTSSKVEEQQFEPRGKAKNVEKRKPVQDRGAGAASPVGTKTTYGTSWARELPGDEVFPPQKAQESGPLPMVDTGPIDLLPKESPETHSERRTEGGGEGASDSPYLNQDASPSPRFGTERAEQPMARPFDQEVKPEQPTSGLFEQEMKPEEFRARMPEMSQNDAQEDNQEGNQEVNQKGIQEDIQEGTLPNEPNSPPQPPVMQAGSTSEMGHSSAPLSGMESGRTDSISAYNPPADWRGGYGRAYRTGMESNDADQSGVGDTLLSTQHAWKSQPARSFRLVPGGSQEPRKTEKKDIVKEEKQSGEVQHFSKHLDQEPRGPRGNETRTITEIQHQYRETQHFPEPQTQEPGGNETRNIIENRHQYGEAQHFPERRAHETRGAPGGYLAENQQAHAEGQHVPQHQDQESRGAQRRDFTEHYQQQGGAQQLTQHQHQTMEQPIPGQYPFYEEASETEDASSNKSDAPSQQYTYRSANGPNHREHQPGMIKSLVMSTSTSTKGSKRNILQRNRTPDPKMAVIAPKSYPKDVESRCKQVSKQLGVSKKHRSDTWFETLLARLPDRIDSLMYDLSDAKAENKHLRKDYNRVHGNFADLEKTVQTCIKDNEDTKRARSADHARYKVEWNKLIQQHEYQISQLKASHYQAQREHKDLVSQLEASHRHAEEKHQAEVARLHEAQRQAQAEHEKQVQALNTAAQARIAAQAKQLGATIRSQKQIIASHSREDHNPTPDDAFQLAFQALCQDVGNLTGYVRRSAGSLPLGEAGVSAQAAAYLARNGGGGAGGGRVWPRFCRSVCWEVLVKGFFRGQPGYGVLGAEGEGYNLLCGLRELFVQQHHTSDMMTTSDRRGDPANTKDANAWRAQLFTALLRAVKSPQIENGTLPSSRGDQQQQRLAVLFHQNVDRVARALTESLERISGGGGGGGGASGDYHHHSPTNEGLDPRAPPQIKAVARQVGLLALEMASQRAHLLVETAPAGGKRIRCGPEERFRNEGGGDFGAGDYEDYEGYGGGGGSGLVTVVLTTQPCLRKVGDGRDDVASENVLVAGQVVALQE